MVAEHYAPRAGAGEHVASVGRAGRRDAQRGRPGAGPAPSRLPASGHAPTAAPALGDAGRRHRRGRRALQRARAPSAAAKRGTTDEQPGPERHQGDVREGALVVLASRVRGARAPAGEAAPDLSRAAGRLLSGHSPGRAGAAAVGSLRAVAALGGQGRAGPLPPDPGHRGDRPRVRQPEPQGRARHPRGGGGRVEAALRDDLGCNGLLQAPVEPGEPDRRHAGGERRRDDR